MSDPAPTDWGDGDYAPTADALAPTVPVVLDAVRLAAGDHLVDAGCGTGNAMIEAARRGAAVAGFDPSPRLVGEARRRLSEAGLPGEVRVGTAEAPPADLGAADVVVSVFAVIFAGDPAAAAHGLVGLARPGGRLALTSWLPGGAIGAVGRLLRGAVPAAPAPADPPRWHEPAWIEALLRDAGADAVASAEHTLVFRHASPETWFAEQEALHPVWRSVRSRLSDDAWRAVHDRSLEELHAANEDPGAFAVTSAYLVVTAAR